MIGYYHGLIKNYVLFVIFSYNPVSLDSIHNIVFQLENQQSYSIWRKIKVCKIYYAVFNLQIMQFFNSQN